MGSPGAPVLTGARAPPPAPGGGGGEGRRGGDLEKWLNLQIFQACSHESFFPAAFIFIFSNVSWSTGCRPPGWEFMRPGLLELKLARDGFACLASERQEQTWWGRACGAGQHDLGLHCLAQSEGLGTAVTGPV